MLAAINMLSGTSRLVTQTANGVERQVIVGVDKAT
jgi:hypothetical protein